MQIATSRTNLYDKDNFSEFDVDGILSPCLTSTFDNCGCTALDMPERREMTEQIDGRAQQLSVSQMACVSEDLQC